jgi:hypothetical protein
MPSSQSDWFTPRQIGAFAIGIVVAVGTSHYAGPLIALPLDPYLGGIVSRAIATGTCWGLSLWLVAWIEETTRSNHSKSDD